MIDGFVVCLFAEEQAKLLRGLRGSRGGIKERWFERWFERVERFEGESKRRISRLFVVCRGNKTDNKTRQDIARHSTT